MEEFNIYKACRKHAQPTHHITEEQRLRQVHFVKDAKRHTKKISLSTKEFKDLNLFIKDKINETIKEHNHVMHVISNFEELSISSSNESIQSIVSDTSVEDSDNEDHKPAAKK
eukprot:13541303-Ditylum_brightwellii.AAC.1